LLEYNRTKKGSIVVYYPPRLIDNGTSEKGKASRT